MSSHVELNPDDDVLGLTLGMKAMRLALTQKTHKMGTVRIPGADGTDVIIGAGASDGVNRVDKDGVQLPLVDTSVIDKAAQDAQQKADDAIAKADEAIAKGEQIRRDAQAGIDDARKAAQDAAVKADKVRTDIQAEVDANKKATDSAIAAVDKKADKVRTDLDSQTTALKSSISAVEAKADQVKAAADKLSQRVDADKAALDKSITDVDAKAQAASDKGDRLAGRISDVTTTVNGHTTKLGELSTRIEGVASDGQTTVKSLTDLRQTVTGLSSTVSQNTKTAQSAVDKVSQVEQTANGISATLSKNYTSTADADKKYAAKTELKTTADGLQANITKSQQTADGAVTAANKAQATADGINATLSKDYQTARDSDAKYSTKAELKATSAGLSSSISSVKQTADGAVTAASKAQQTADGISLNLGKNYATKAQNDVIYATQSNLKATSDSLTASINSTAKTAQSAVDKTTSLEANLNGFKTSVAKTYQDKAGMSAYATTSQLQQTADSIKSQVSAVSQTASGAMSKAASLEQTANGLSAKVSETAKTLDTTVTTANAAKSTADSNKQTISQVKTTADGAVNRVSSLEQNLSGFKQTVSQTYTTKTDFNNLTIGGTNLLKKTSPKWSDWITITPNIANFCVNIGLYTTEDGLVPDAWYSSQIELEFADVTSTEGHEAVAWSQGSVDNGWTGIFNPFTENLLPRTAIKNTVYSLKHSNKARNTNAKNKKFDFQIRCDHFASGKIRYRKAKWEVSSKPTDWSPAPEDLQPAGDYVTNSSLTQTANSIKAQVTEVSKTANSAMSKATTVEQTANGLSTRITEQAKTLGATVKTANEAKSTADSNKTAISQVSTTANNALSKTSSLEQNLSGFKTSVADTYTTKADFNNLTIGGTNLLLNTSGVFVGHPSASGVNANAGWLPRLVDGLTYSTLSAGTYQLRFEVMTDTEVGSYIVQWADTPWGISPFSSFSLSKGVWKTLTYTIVKPDGATGKARGFMLRTDNVPTSATIRVRRAKLERGSRPTDWSPAPQDSQAAGDYATNSSLTQTASQIRSEVAEKYQSKSGMSSYATTSALTQKADEITGKVTEVAKTAQGNTTTISQVSQKADKINTTLSQQIGGKADTSRVSSLEQNLDGFKTTVAKTYQTKGDYPTKTEVQSRIDQSASSIKSTVGQTYTTLAATEELRKSASRTFQLYGANGTGPKWVKLGYLTSNGDTSSVLLHVYSGDGYNGQSRQNAEFEIFVKDGWQQTPSASYAFGVSVKRIRNADGVKVKVLAFDDRHCDVWAFLPWYWWNGHYTLQGDYQAWLDGPNCGGERIQDAEPTNGTAQDLAYDTISTRSYVDQTSRSVALGVVQNYKGADGSGLATKSDITVAKDGIASTVAGTYATKSGVTQEISSKIVQNNNSLDVRFATKTETRTAQDTASTAKSNASNAQSRVGALEDCISLTSAGVRAGHKANGVFNGVSALVNTDGSFDLLDKDGKLLTRINRHSFQVAGDDGVGSGHLTLSQDGLDITVQPTANKTFTYYVQLGAGGIGITAPDGSHINCSARTGLDLETVRYGKLSIDSGGLQFTNDQGWGLLLSAAGWSLKWAGNHTLATGPTAGRLYLDGREIMTR